jgi:thiol-disulfide isomerase/thioredoxin
MEKRTPYNLILLLAWSFIPAVSRADKAGDALLQKCFEAETNAATLEADFTHQRKENGQTRVQTGTLQLKKPNLAHIVVNSSKGQGSNIVINSDGRQFVTYTYADNAYANEIADIAGSNVARNNINETKIFFFPDYLNRLRFAATGARITGAVTVGSVACKSLELTGLPQKVKLYVGSDGLLRGTLIEGSGLRDETHLTNVKAGKPLVQTAFHWNPPRGAKTVQQVVASEAASEAAAAQGKQAVSLLAVGKTVPDFTLPLATGGKVTLSTELKKNRVTLLNFWACFCGPCREELPHLSKMAADLKSKGFAVLTVNTAGDTAQAIQKLFKDKLINLPSFMDNGPISSQYGIQAIPTNYVLDSSGKILGAFEGFDENGIRQALAKAGIK